MGSHLLLVEGLAYAAPDLAGMGVLSASALQSCGASTVTVTAIDRRNAVVRLSIPIRDDYPSFFLCACGRVWPLAWMEDPPGVHTFDGGVTKAADLYFDCETCGNDRDNYTLPVLRGPRGDTNALVAAERH
jgi:hypothetical protein